MINDRVRIVLIRAVAALPSNFSTASERSLLVIRPDHLGDVLFTTPGLHRLRSALPGWKVTLAVGEWSATVAANIPDVDDVLTIPFPGFTRAPKKHPLDPYILLRECAAQLAERRFQAAVILRDDHWWGAMLAKLAGIPVRIGSDHSLVSPLVSHAVPVTGHSVQRDARLLDAAVEILSGRAPNHPVTPESDPLRWPISEEERQSATDLTGDVRYVVIHPGSGAPVKLWPSSRWARVADALAESGTPVFLTGSEGERGLVDEVRSIMSRPATSLAGRTDLMTLAAVFSSAELVLGVDSGPLHLAVAAGAPTVHLFGPSDPARFGPWGLPEGHRVVSAEMHCPRCGDLSIGRQAGAGCMLAIDVRTVLAAAKIHAHA